MRDLSSWYTKETAALALNCSTKTLERLVAQGRIHTEIWKRPAGAAISVYHPKDVAKEAQRRNPDPKSFVLPPSAEPAIAGALLPPSSGDLSILPVPSWAIEQAKLKENTALALSDVSKTLEKLQQNAATLPVDRKLFLSRKEAAEYSGLPKSTIVAAINAGICKAVRTGRGIRIMRESLDSLELAAFLDTFEPPAPRPAPPRPRYTGLVAKLAMAPEDSKGDHISSGAGDLTPDLVVPRVEPTD